MKCNQEGGVSLFAFYIRGIADSQTLMAIIGTYGDSLSLQVQKKQKGLSAGSQAKTGSNGAVSHSPQWKCGVLRPQAVHNCRAQRLRRTTWMYHLAQSLTKFGQSIALQ